MDDKIHSNYKIAAYLIFAAITVDLISGFIQWNKNPNFDMTVTAEMALMFMTFAYFAFIGKDWIRWVILLATVLPIFPLVATFNQQTNDIDVFYISQFASSLLKFSAFIMLSSIKKK